MTIHQWFVEWNEPHYNAEELAIVEKNYDPSSVFIFKAGVKVGRLSLYVHSSGCGWSWMCGRGHELRWWPL